MSLNNMPEQEGSCAFLKHSSYSLKIHNFLHTSSDSGRHAHVGTLCNIKTFVTQSQKKEGVTFKGEEEAWAHTKRFNKEVSSLGDSLIHATPHVPPTEI